MAVMSKRSVGVSLEDGLLARVDEARGDTSRSLFITRALEVAVGADAVVQPREWVNSDEPGSVLVGPSREPVDAPRVPGMPTARELVEQQAAVPVRKESAVDRNIRLREERMRR